MPTPTSCLRITRAELWPYLRRCRDAAFADGCAFVLIVHPKSTLAEAQWLSPADHRRLAVLQQEQDRAQLILGRTLIQQLARPDWAPQPTPLSAGRHGKPVLHHGYPFNLTHSAGFVACAVCSRDEIGIDIETAAALPADVSLLGLIAHPAERRLIEQTQGKQRDEHILRCWCRKEAMLKQQGCGLIDTLTAIDVRLDQASPLLANDTLRLLDLKLPASGLHAALALATAVRGAIIHSVNCATFDTSIYSLSERRVLFDQ